EAAEAHIDEWLVVVPREARHLVAAFVAHAALQILEPRRVERVAPLESELLRIEHQVHIGRGLVELAERIGLVPDLGEELVEAVVAGLDLPQERLLEGPEAG